MTGLAPVSPTLSEEMLETLTEAHQHGIFTKGNFARIRANPIAEAACRSWITTDAGLGVYGNRWLITTRGLAALRHFSQGSTFKANAP